MKGLVKHRSRVEGLILFLREERVLLDADLATIYGVSTKALNQAVKRNGERFPIDFRFQLSDVEKQEVVTKCDLKFGVGRESVRADGVYGTWGVDGGQCAQE